MEYAVKIENLEKSYGTNKVLKGISFAVKRGEIFALLGINGAGKTSTLECMEGLRKYDRGKIQMNGSCGVQLQSSSLPKNIKVGEAVRFFAKWNHAEIIEEYLDNLGVTPFINKQYAQLSVGQSRRLHLALALLGTPDIIVLDEPTAGLDVEGRISIHGEIKALKEQGKTIILASHDMAEVEQLCDRLAILKDGKIAFIGTPAEMTENVQNGFRLKIRFSKQPDNNQMNHLSILQEENGYYIIQTQSIETTLTEILAYVKEQQTTIRDIKVEQADMEQRFLEIAKEG